ncbi:MAG: PilT/PilU family type 4a pilus ATPase [Myxococcota bacterium]
MAVARGMWGSEEFVHQLLRKAVGAEASDVHLKVGQPPGVRVGGDMVYFKTEKLQTSDTEAVVRLLLSHGRGSAPGARQTLDDLTECDTSYEVEGVGRFRVNIYRQRGTFAVVMRVIPVEVPSLAELGLPTPVLDLAERERGMALVVGATGNGKTTTLAAMVHHINLTRSRHIVTIEDPIEFIHRDQRSSVSQREVGLDTPDFATALRSALRQDPDVLLVGEIRDTETMEIAVQAAETGHLVLSTLHTPDVTRCINRLIALADNPGELRERIADCLQGVIAQRLVPRADHGLALAMEIMVVTGTVREALKRPDANPPLKELMERGVTPYGMQTFAMALRRLVQEGLVTKEVAQSYLGF